MNCFVWLSKSCVIVQTTLLWLYWHCVTVQVIVWYFPILQLSLIHSYDLLCRLCDLLCVTVQELCDCPNYTPVTVLTLCDCPSDCVIFSNFATKSDTFIWSVVSTLWFALCDYPRVLWLSKLHSCDCIFNMWLSKSRVTVQNLIHSYNMLCWLYDSLISS